MTRSPAQSPAGRPLTGKKVLVWFLGFFLVIVGANVTMSWFAITTFSGVETKDAYVKGRDFNDEIARVAAQKALGWTIVVQSEPLGQHEAFITVLVNDRQASPLESLTVKGVMARPVVKGVDQDMVFVSLGDGRYGSGIKLPAPGRWQLRAMVIDAAGNERKIVHDIVVS